MHMIKELLLAALAVIVGLRRVWSVRGGKDLRQRWSWRFWDTDFLEKIASLHGVGLPPARAGGGHVIIHASCRFWMTFFSKIGFLVRKIRWTKYADQNKNYPDRDP